MKVSEITGANYYNKNSNASFSNGINFSALAVTKAANADSLFFNKYNTMRLADRVPSDGSFAICLIKTSISDFATTTNLKTEFSNRRNSCRRLLLSYLLPASHQFFGVHH